MTERLRVIQELDERVELFSTALEICNDERTLDSLRTAEIALESLREWMRRMSIRMTLVESQIRQEITHE